MSSPWQQRGQPHTSPGRHQGPVCCLQPTAAVSLPPVPLLPKLSSLLCPFLPLLLGAFLPPPLLHSFIFPSLTICHPAAGTRLHFPLSAQFLSTLLPSHRGTCNTGPSTEAFARPIPVPHPPAALLETALRGCDQSLIPARLEQEEGWGQSPSSSHGVCPGDGPMVGPGEPEPPWGP